MVVRADRSLVSRAVGIERGRLSAAHPVAGAIDRLADAKTVDGHHRDAGDHQRLGLRAGFGARAVGLRSSRLESRQTRGSLAQSGRLDRRDPGDGSASKRERMAERSGKSLDPAAGAFCLLRDLLRSFALAMSAKRRPLFGTNHPTGHSAGYAKRVTTGTGP